MHVSAVIIFFNLIVFFSLIADDVTYVNDVNDVNYVNYVKCKSDQLLYEKMSKTLTLVMSMTLM